jgi:hypothetical protein
MSDAEGVLASTVHLLEQARLRLLRASDMLVAVGAIEEDEDAAENADFCAMLQAKIDELRAPHVIADKYAEDDQAIHLFFGLTYAAYLVVPRSVLQSMPPVWQRKLATLLDEGQELAAGLDIPEYRVHAVDSDGKFCRDPYRDYQRGRRRVPLESTK